MKHQSKGTEDQGSEKPQASRRSFLASSVAGFGAAWVATRWSGILEAQAFALKAAESGPPTKFEFFSPEDAVEIESVVGQIIPSDETPGAREAGTAYFIDRALTTFDRDEQPRYKQGLKDLQAKTRELFPKANKFSDLTSPEQIQVLTALEETPFFALVRQHTIVGFLADPVHGGNRDEIGWKLIGFGDKFNYAPPFGYYDANYKQDT